MPDPPAAEVRGPGRDGANAKQVQHWLGHHSPAFTLAVYVHLLPEDAPDAEFLEEILGSSHADVDGPTGQGTARDLEQRHDAAWRILTACRKTTPRPCHAAGAASRGIQTRSAKTRGPLARVVDRTA